MLSVKGTKTAGLATFRSPSLCASSTMPTICNQEAPIFGGDNTVARHSQRMSDGVAIRKVAPGQGAVDHGYMGTFGILGVAPNPSLRQENAKDREVLRTNEVGRSHRRVRRGFAQDIKPPKISNPMIHPFWGGVAFVEIAAVSRRMSPPPSLAAAQNKLHAPAKCDRSFGVKEFLPPSHCAGRNRGVRGSTERTP